MPRIPVREDYFTTPSSPNIQPAQAPALPEASFGGAVGEGIDRFGQAVQQLGARLGEIGIRKQQEDRDKQILAADKAYRDSLMQIVNDPKDGLINRQLDAANGVSNEFNALALKARKDILDGIKDQGLVSALSEKGGVFDRTTEPYYSRIITHEAAQNRAAYDQANASAIDNALEDAKLFTTPKELLSAADKAVAISTNYLATTGQPSETILQKSNDVYAKALTDAIANRIDADPAGALKTLAAIRSQVPPGVMAAVEKTLDGKFTSLQAADFWSGPAQAFRRMDGSYDTAAIRQAVDSMPDTSQDKKDRIYSDVNGRATAAESNYKQAQANDILQAKSEALRMQQQGASIEQIKKQVVGAHAGFGIQHQYELEQDITKLFDNRVVEDNAVWVEAYRQIKAGKWNLQDLAGVRGQLSKSHYEALQKEYNDNLVNPKTGFPAAHDEIDAIMDRSIGKDQKRREQFAGALQDRFLALGGTATAAQYVDLAREEAKKVPAGKWAIWPHITTYKPEYQIENPNPDTAEYKAVQRLRETGRAVLPDSIKTVISRHPEWQK